MIKHLKTNALVLFLISFIVLYFVLKDQFQDILKTLLDMNYVFLFIAVLCLVIYLVFRAFCLVITARQENEKYTFSQAFKHIVITQFFNGITPFSTGGQPMEIYMLHSMAKISYAKSTNLIMQSFLFYQIALVILGVIAVILNGTLSIFKEVSILKVLVLVGFFLNTIVAILTILVSFSKKVNAWCVNKGIHLLAKARIIKNKDLSMEKWKVRLAEFHETAMQLKKNKSVFVIGTVYNFIALVFLYVIPLFLLYSLGDFNSMNPLTVIVASAYVLLMGSFVPIPGASGGIEYGFIAFFGNFIQGPKLAAIMLIWRFITYYLPMIVGAVFFSFNKGEKEQ